MAAKESWSPRDDDTEFGKIAAGLGERQDETEFQAGLRHFSVLLVEVAGVLTTSIFVINLILQRPLLESLLFSLAIAVGITPAVAARGGDDQPGDRVASSCPPGSAGQAARVHRGSRRHRDPADGQDRHAHRGTNQLRPREWTRPVVLISEVFRLGLFCNEATVEDGQVVGGNPLDVALWEAPEPRP